MMKLYIAIATAICLFSGLARAQTTPPATGVQPYPVTAPVVSAQHFGGYNTAPTIVAGGGAGTSPTIALDANAHDAAFDIVLTTGTSPTASGIIATVTFNAGYGNQPHCPAPGAETTATAILTGTSAVIATTGTTTYVLTAGSAALTAATSYRWSVSGCVQ